MEQSDVERRRSAGWLIDPGPLNMLNENPHVREYRRRQTLRRLRDRQPDDVWRDIDAWSAARDGVCKPYEWFMRLVGWLLFPVMTDTTFWLVRDYTSITTVIVRGAAIFVVSLFLQIGFYAAMYHLVIPHALRRAGLEKKPWEGW